jgi:hypothetical protein
MLASPVDMTGVNALVDQMSQARAGMQKALLAARAQMQQVMGADNLQKYMRGMRRALAHRFPQGHPMRRLPPGPGGNGLWM